MALAHAHVMLHMRVHRCGCMFMSLRLHVVDMVCLSCVCAAAPYTLDKIAFGAQKGLSVATFGQLPAYRDAQLELVQTTAIARYVAKQHGESTHNRHTCTCAVYELLEKRRVS